MTDSAILTAEYIITLPVTHTVTFDSKGGTDIAPGIVNDGEPLALPEPPTMPGSVFGGWYDESLTSAWDIAAPVYADMTLSAKWYSADDIDVQDFGPGAVLTQVFDAGTIFEWQTALTAIRDGGNDRNYIINITADFPMAGSAADTFGTVTGLKVSIRGDYAVSMSQDGSKGSILRTMAGQALVVRDVDFTGMTDNTDPLIYMSAGALTLRGSASVSGNSSSYGGGVYVGGGTFTMRDTATVSGNSSYYYGGGVFVRGGGTFTMEGSASVSGNSSDDGGGVYVNGRTFQIRSNGTVYGSNAGDNSNSAPAGSGAALFKDTGTAIYGLLFDGIFTQVGTLDTTDDTIEVVNGALQ